MRGRFLFFCFHIFLVCSLFSQNEYKKGVILDSIPVPKSSNQSFALYLPESYQKSLPSSIVFIFDPSARAAVGIQPFIQASEKYGHILICSNNSRNGSYERNFDIANNLFNHAFSNFNIKENEMYLTGFSGGSRLACAIASITNRFAAVVACGAGFPSSQDLRPSLQNYSYVGLVGDRDMNYKEMLKNKGFLRTLKFKSTLFTYDGEHSWPPQEELTRAFDWLHVEKMKNSTQKETTEVLALYHSEYERTKALKAKNLFLRTSEQYSRMIDNFKDFIDTDSLVQQHQQLLTSKDYKKQKAAFSNTILLEQKISKKLLPRILSDLKNPQSVNFAWWEKELTKLDKMSTKNKPELEKMVYRIKFDLFARAYSQKYALQGVNSKAQYEVAERFIKIFYPRN